MTTEQPKVRYPTPTNRERFRSLQAEARAILARVTFATKRGEGERIQRLPGRWHHRRRLRDHTFTRRTVFASAVMPVYSRGRLTGRSIIDQDKPGAYVAGKVKAERRRKNKVARASRRRNRR